VGDALIAATALVNDRTLLTHNVDDFAGIAGLIVIDPLATP
jgi:predicted nucleic acid-binding protein